MHRMCRSRRARRGVDCSGAGHRSEVTAAQWASVIGMVIVVTAVLLTVLLVFAGRPLVWVPAIVIAVALATAAAWLLAHTVGPNTDAFRKALSVAVAGGLFVGVAVGAILGGFREERGGV